MAEGIAPHQEDVRRPGICYWCDAPWPHTDHRTEAGDGGSTTDDPAPSGSHIAPVWAAKNALPTRLAEWMEQYGELDGVTEPSAGWQGGWEDGYARGLAAGRTESRPDEWTAKATLLERWLQDAGYIGTEPWFADVTYVIEQAWAAHERDTP